MPLDRDLRIISDATKDCDMTDVEVDACRRLMFAALALSEACGAAVVYIGCEDGPDRVDRQSVLDILNKCMNLVHGDAPIPE